MRKVFEFDVNEVVPTPAEVLEAQGMTGRENLPARITSLLDSAIELFKQLAEPRGVLEDFPTSNFEAIYNGNGMNSAEGAVPLIVPKADAMALFAATLGNALIAKSSELFAQGGPALGFMLDAVNSSGAEHLGMLMGHRFLELLPEDQIRSREPKVQYYSPGHCGWHISGQTKLFQALHPDEIGVSLNERWVMIPVKSISGFLIAGDIEAHRFHPSFSFCKQCKTHKCAQRFGILEKESFQR